MKKEKVDAQYTRRKYLLLADPGLGDAVFLQYQNCFQQAYKL